MLANVKLFGAFTKLINAAEVMITLKMLNTVAKQTLGEESWGNKNIYVRSLFKLKYLTTRKNVRGNLFPTALRTDFSQQNLVAHLNPTDPLLFKTAKVGLVYVGEYILFLRKDRYKFKSNLFVTNLFQWVVKTGAEFANFNSLFYPNMLLGYHLKIRSKTNKKEAEKKQLKS
ncbi:hypothetical protein EGR_04061 [Echinococcus granulosus]|uniref:Uncharacterized protein n=1 Tax=Echinococcus granulosus TaxID=6210 RepID=W6UJ22_ECHGR|nr:hypothetical protein EGR_04061 [Echinococcus granulosus]EUB61028.1 hypothetical protein EGR_04061 [Echinococcus granulosus]